MYKREVWDGIDWMGMEKVIEMREGSMMFPGARPKTRTK
jgi:hypothetical protein